jgi:hypothetical protein
MRPHRPAGFVSARLLVVSGVLTACAAIPAPTVEPSVASPPPLEVQEPADGLAADDPRLEPILEELRANPEWLDEPLPEEPEILALIPGTSEVCLALRGPRGDVFVTIDPEEPWRVALVGIDRGAAGREFTHDPNGTGDDICTFVVSGRADPWPDDPDAIVVQGNVAGDAARAIAQAVHAAPDRFGIDRHGIPAVNVGDTLQPAPDGWRCAWGYVYVGGPRSTVVIGTRPAADGWEVETRIVERALIEPEARRDGHC